MPPSSRGVFCRGKNRRQASNPLVWKTKPVWPAIFGCYFLRNDNENPNPQWIRCAKHQRKNAPVFSSWWFQPLWKVLYSQNGNLPQIGLKVKIVKTTTQFLNMDHWNICDLHPPNMEKVTPWKINGWNRKITQKIEMETHLNQTSIIGFKMWIFQSLAFFEKASPVGFPFFVEEFMNEKLLDDPMKSAVLVADRHLPLSSFAAWTSMPFFGGEAYPSWN